MKEMQLSRIIDMEDPQSVLDEVRTIALMMFQDFDFDTVDRVFKDIVRLSAASIQDTANALPNTTT